MSYQNKRFLTNAFLLAALLVSGACTLGGCTSETEPEGYEPAGRRIPLIVRATASAFVPTDQDDDAATRIPTENGFTTEFENGDAIGIFALVEYETPDVATVDDVYNLKLVYTKAVDGTGSWTPEDPTKALYSYNDDLTYIAYYPYRDGVTIKQDNFIEIFKKLAKDLPPAADQSTPEAYTGSDLMAAFAKPTTDPTDANKKVLTLNFEHLHGLLVFKPTEGFLRYVSPDGGFEYREEARELLGSRAAEATINNVKACLMDDGSFRALFSVSGAAFTPSGSYLLTDGKKLLFTGSELAAGTFSPGKCYTLETNSQLGIKKRGVQTGDFFYRDGKLLHREISVIPDPTNCVGIVVNTVGAGGSDAAYGGKCVANIVHGHILSVYDVATCQWGPSGTDIKNSTGDSHHDYRGYQLNQNIINDANTNYGSLSPSNYAAAYYCLNYGDTEKGRLETTKNSGWYFPSEGFLRDGALYLKPYMGKLVSAGYGQNFAGDNYWDVSGTGDNSKARVVNFSNNRNYSYPRANSYRVRAMLTF